MVCPCLDGRDGRSQHLSQSSISKLRRGAVWLSYSEIGLCRNAIWLSWSGGTGLRRGYLWRLLTSVQLRSWRRNRILDILRDGRQEIRLGRLSGGSLRFGGYRRSLRLDDRRWCLGFNSCRAGLFRLRRRLSQPYLRSSLSTPVARSIQYSLPKRANIAPLSDLYRSISPATRPGLSLLCLIGRLNVYFL